MSESQAFTDAAANGPDAGDRAVVVLLSVWWKNPLLWIALGIGISMTLMMAMSDSEGVQGTAGVFGAMTVALATLAHVALLARLEIGPDGFREKLTIWRTIEHRWADVGEFYVRKDDEAEDAVGFAILKDGQYTKSDTLMGAYSDGVKALTKRMNAARAKALGAGATSVASHSPG